MRNPWLDLPKRPPYVLHDDRRHVEAFNRCQKRREHKLDLDLIPEPFLGPRKAPLVLLMLDPGRPAGSLALHRSGYRRALRQNLGDNPEGQRHRGFRPELATSAWWSNRFKKVIEAGHDLDELS